MFYHFYSECLIEADRLTVDNYTSVICLCQKTLLPQYWRTVTLVKCYTPRSLVCESVWPVPVSGCTWHTTTPAHWPVHRLGNVSVLFLVPAKYCSTEFMFLSKPHPWSRSCCFFGIHGWLLKFMSDCWNLVLNQFYVYFTANRHI